MRKIIPKLLIFIALPFFGWAQSKTDSVKMGKAAASKVMTPQMKVTDLKVVAPVGQVKSAGQASGTQASATQASGTQPAAAPAAASSGSGSSTGGHSAFGGLDPNPCIFPGHTNDGQILTCYDGYYLTGVTVRFYTGNDNKEYPSSVNIRVTAPNGSNNAYTYLYSNESQADERKKEYKSNSMTSVTLQTPYVLFNGTNNEYDPNKLWFAAIQNSGMVLEVTYSPNLLTDAWKIEKVEVVFQVKKGSGAAHPQFNNKTITFNYPKLLVSGAGVKNSLVMRVDGQLNAGMAY